MEDSHGLPAMPILGSVPDASRPRWNHRNVPPDPESTSNCESNQLNETVQRLEQDVPLSHQARDSNAAQPICRWFKNGSSWFLSGSPSCLVVVPSALATLQQHQAHRTKAYVQLNQGLVCWTS